MRLCGTHALDSCRLEKAYRHYGHDMASTDHVLEAGLGFAVKLDKAKGRFGDFIGREAVLQRKQAGLSRRLVQFLLADPRPLLYGNEAILRDGRVVGYLTSGAYGHHLGAAVGLGYVACEPGESAAELLASVLRHRGCLRAGPGPRQPRAALRSQGRTPARVGEKHAARGASPSCRRHAFGMRRGEGDASAAWTAIAARATYSTAVQVAGRIGWG